VQPSKSQAYLFWRGLGWALTDLGVEGCVEVRDVAAGDAIEDVSFWSWSLSSWSLAAEGRGVRTGLPTDDGVDAKYPLEFHAGRRLLFF